MFQIAGPQVVCIYVHIYMYKGTRTKKTEGTHLANHPTVETGIYNTSIERGMHGFGLRRYFRFEILLDSKPTIHHRV